MPTSAVRLRLYGCERMKRERLIGEALIRGTDIDLVKGSTHWYTMKPRNELTVGLEDNIAPFNNSNSNVTCNLPSVDRHKSDRCVGRWRVGRQVMTQVV